MATGAFAFSTAGGIVPEYFIHESDTFLIQLLSRSTHLEVVPRDICVKERRNMSDRIVAAGKQISKIDTLV